MKSAIVVISLGIPSYFRSWNYQDEVWEDTDLFGVAW
jgi:hypothetical protein